MRLIIYLFVSYFPRIFSLVAFSITVFFKGNLEMNHFQVFGNGIYLSYEPCYFQKTLLGIFAKSFLRLLIIIICVVVTRSSFNEKKELLIKILKTNDQGLNT